MTSSAYASHARTAVLVGALIMMTASRFPHRMSTVAEWDILIEPTPRRFRLTVGSETSHRREALAEKMRHHVRVIFTLEPSTPSDNDIVVRLIDERSGEVQDERSALEWKPRPTVWVGADYECRSFPCESSWIVEVAPASGFTGTYEANIEVGAYTDLDAGSCRAESPVDNVVHDIDLVELE